jgi:hypothetical protein
LVAVVVLLVMPTFYPFPPFHRSSGGG